MKRGKTARCEVTALGGDRDRAFVPPLLPHVPPLVLSDPLRQALESAVLAPGRVDGASALLHDKAFFHCGHVRNAAALSCETEDTELSMCGLLHSSINVPEETG